MTFLTAASWQNFQELPLRLANFIISNLEPILVEWETFARSLEAGEHMDWLALRDHAGLILKATAKDMVSPQTTAEQCDKAKGLDTPDDNDALDGASDAHARDRLSHGFNMMEMMSEYRALRGSVLHLWQASEPDPEERDIDDMTRFNESIDQSLSTAIASYTDRVEQARVTFLAILGHDLRNPLSAISMAATLIPMVRMNEAETLQCSSIIANSTSSMNRMINDLLDFTRSRLGSGMPLKLAPVELGILGAELVAECRTAHPAREIGFIQSGSLQGACDSDRIRQAISNLMGNALQHGSMHEPITLSLNGEPSTLIISVHNGGKPIPPCEMHSIFEPLVRGAGTAEANDARAGSIGLGLYIAREVAESHGGRINVSSSLEAGTTFTIRIPREACAEIGQADSRCIAESSATLRDG